MTTITWAGSRVGLNDEHTSLCGEIKVNGGTPAMRDRYAEVYVSAFGAKLLAESTNRDSKASSADLFPYDAYAHQSAIGRCGGRVDRQFRNDWDSTSGGQISVAGPTFYRKTPAGTYQGTQFDRATTALAAQPNIPVVRVSDSEAESTYRWRIADLL